ncbi:MAG: hypothetical protein GY714_21670 [Desulfobacterales bacterium]|nr:hypothetical protein [Desulfobacterales bacterium]
MNWTEEKINQTIIDIKKKSSEDEAFRKLCMDNPNEAIRKVSNMEVPEGLKINIIENNSGVDHTIILPPKSSALIEEVPDQVAGGRCHRHIPCP